MREDFLTLLHQEHQKVMSTMERLEQMPMRETDQKENLFREFRHDLTAHMDGEEKYWYPALERNDQTRMDSMLAQEEHRAARTVFRHLEDTDMDDMRWMARLTVLKELISHHIEEEEGRLFDETRQTMTDSQVDTIMREFQEEKQRSRGILERIMGT